jgi:hypothetical protein
LRLCQIIVSIDQELLSRILLESLTDGARRSVCRTPNMGGDMKVRSVFGILLLSLTAVASFAVAGDFQPVPEPGILELLSIGAVAAVVVAIRKRRK